MATSGQLSFTANTRQVIYTASDRGARLYLWTQTGGAATFYVGGSTVDSSNGLILPTGSTQPFQLGENEALYAYASGGAGTLYYLATGEPID